MQPTTEFTCPQTIKLCSIQSLQRTSARSLRLFTTLTSNSYSNVLNVLATDQVKKYFITETTSIGTVPPESTKVFAHAPENSSYLLQAVFEIQKARQVAV